MSRTQTGREKAKIFHLETSRCMGVMKSRVQSARGRVQTPEMGEKGKLRASKTFNPERDGTRSVLY